MKSALITGVGKKNIGLSIAKKIASAGHTVVVADYKVIDKDSIDEISAVNDAIDVIPLQVDVSSYNSIVTLMDEAFAASPELGYLVNAAGISQPLSPLEISPADWEKMMAVNFSGTFYCCQLFIKKLIEKNRGGSIVNTASIAAQSGGRHNGVHYAASKAGVVSLTRGFARYFGHKDIRVNAVAPGVIDTSMVNTFDFFMEQGKKSPLGRVGDALEVARCVYFLLSDEASYVTGEVLTVSGGI